MRGFIFNQHIFQHQENVVIHILDHRLPSYHEVAVKHKKYPLFLMYIFDPILHILWTEFHV